MPDYRLILYADGLALPIVLHLKPGRVVPDLYLREALRYDLVLTRAELWSGNDKIKIFGPIDFEEIVRARDNLPPPKPPLH